MFLDIIQTIILGIVQGITEWLPVSSTGHMILINEFLKINVSSEFMSMFLVVIQLASIMAVVTLFFKQLFPWGFKKTADETKDTFSLWFKILVACVPAGIIGILFDERIDELFFNPWTVAIALIFYGVLFIIVENWQKNKPKRIDVVEQITYKTAILVGVFQVLALIPGTSRSGATIIGGLILGMDRTVAASFTFYLAIPVMFGASAVRLLNFGFDFTRPELIILVIGMITAYLVSIIAIRFLLKYIKKNDFKIFGYYRIVLGLIVILYFLFN